MFELSGFESGPVAVALTGAVLGWVLRPLFLRYRPAFFVAIAAITVLAALYGLSSEARAVDDAPALVREVPPRIIPSPPPTEAPASSSEAWADYLEHAGRDAFAEGDYDAASRYWRDAARLSSRRAAELSADIARAQALATGRF
jgi:hypothetical protein